MGKIVMTLLLLSGLAASLPIHAQYDRSGYTLTADSDTVTWQKYLTDNEVKYNLEPIRNSTADFSFRLSSAEHAMAIYRNDTIVHGFITVFTSELKNLQPTGNHFKMTFALTPEQARLAMQIIEDAAISKLPSYSNIPGWTKGNIGGVYLVEQKIAGSYSLKSYWTPESQTGVREADLFNAFMYHFRKICSIPRLFQTFNKAIPFKVWTFGNMSVMRIPDPEKFEKEHGIKLYRGNSIEKR